MKKFFIFFVFILFLFLGSNTVKAANTVTLSGYAWGADDATGSAAGVGWINFNDAGSLYAVEFDRDSWELTGYAYSENYGYIKFGGFSSGFPSGQTACKQNQQNGSLNPCNAHLYKNSNGGYELAGYARFCFVYEKNCDGTLRTANELGGYDGWIGFSGSNFGVSYSTSDNEFKGFAWGGGSSDETNSEYAQGTGWIRMDPRDVGVKCDVAAGKDCISDNDKPIVSLTVSDPNPDYNESITLSWNITGVSSCDSITASSSPSNTNWDNNTSISSMSGNSASFTINQVTTFNLECVNGRESGTDSVMVNVNTYTPTVAWVNVPSSVNYGSNVTLTYNVSNIPFGCSGTLYRNGTPEQSPISVGSSGNRTITVNNLIQNTNWEFWCVDTTPPNSGTRIGKSTIASTTVNVGNPVINLNVKDTSTNSTSTIPCTNTGVTIDYSISGAKPGTCVALINGSNSNSSWGSSTNVIDDGINHTVITGNVTATGNLTYQIQCQKADSSLYTVGKTLNRNCNPLPGSISVVSDKTCYETTDPYINISYTGANLQANSCQKSSNWIDSSWIGNQSNFSSSSQFSPSLLGVGTYSYTMSNCIEKDYPTNPALSSTATIEVKTKCDNCTDPCNPSCPNYKSSFRCSVLKGPKFKEQ